MNRIAKLRISALAGGLALAVLSGVGPASATSGTGWDHTDPSTSCVNGSYSIFSEPIYEITGPGVIGVIDVRYSPACGTNWVRVNNYNASTKAVKWIQREPGWGPPQTEQFDEDWGAGWSYGMQLFAPGCIRVQATIVNSLGNWNGNTGVIRIC